MKEYHKIQSVYLRDPDNKHKTFLMGEWTHPEFGLLRNLEWVGTEKIDGTNIRIIWNGESVRFGGKTDNASIPAVLVEYLTKHFTSELFLTATDEGAIKGPITLYGEGYGGKIQKGSRYQPEQRFILFDAYAECDPLGVWLERSTVEEIAQSIEIPVVPVIIRGPLNDAIDYVRNGFLSEVAQDTTLIAEGLVLRPACELRDRLGRRIITKIKHKDFG